MIMEMTASVSKALQEYERTGGFALAAATDTEDATLAAPAARVEPTEDASAPPHVDEGREVSPPRSVEATEAPAPVAKLNAVEAVVGEEGRSSPGPVAAEAEGVEARVLDEPAIAQESTVPEMVARATTPEIQVAEETGASLSQGAAGGEARMLELARTSSTATSRLDSDSKGDEEAVVRDTLERGMTWTCWDFDELILPATSVSFLVKDSFLIPQFSRALSVIPVLLVADPRVFRSEMHPRCTPTPCGVDPAGDLACRSSGSDNRCRGE
jgi:hypothetical protein